MDAKSLGWHIFEVKVSLKKNLKGLGNTSGNINFKI